MITKDCTHPPFVVQFPDDAHIPPGAFDAATEQLKNYKNMAPEDLRVPLIVMHRGIVYPVECSHCRKNGAG